MTRRRKSIEKLGHPVFIGAVLTLMLNDWYLKEVFHNDLTGKLSDFAGLLAFPFLFTALCPHHAKKIHLATVVLFVAWKSEYAGPLIVLGNAMGIPLGRTVDATDLLALVSVAVSYRLSGRVYTFRLPPALNRLILVASAGAFTATTMAPRSTVRYEVVNKVYAFDFSRRELISKLNMLQVKEVIRAAKFSGLDGKIDFEGDADVFRYRDRQDTLVVLLDYKKLEDSDTITFRRAYRAPLAQLLVAGDEKRSTLKLVHVYRDVLWGKEKDYREQVIRTFERRVIKKIKSHRAGE